MYTFYPVTRRGAAAYIAAADPMAAPFQVSGRASPSLGLTLTATGVDSANSQSFTAGPGGLFTGSTPPTGLQLYGPGDVTGFDARHVVRTEPADGTANYDFDSTDPNTNTTVYYLPGIEFDDPDIPWMFTPAGQAATANGAVALHPWLALIVLAGDEYTLTPAGQAGGLATIAVIAKGLAQLPGLTSSWQWAHTQLAGSLSGGDTLDSTFQATPGQLVSRLLCPRQLSPNTQYTAFLVPAYDAGVTAGGGSSTPAQGDGTGQIGPAWVTASEAAEYSLTATQALTLPVYYSFSFTTGAAGDFRSLALRLVPQTLASAGQRPMAVDDARNNYQWGPLTEITSGDAPLQLGGALQSPGGAADDWSLADQIPFQSQFANLVNLASAPVTDDASQPDPVVAPPIYGRYHAAVNSVTPGNTSWVDVLNLDPRLRAAAGLGAQVVTAERSQLMVSAWRQIRGVELANQILRQAQLNRASLQQPYQQTFGTVTPTSLLILAANVQRRVLLLSGATAWSAISASPVPWRIFTAGIRRLTRPRGPWRRRQNQVGRSLDQMVTSLNDGTLNLSPAQVPSGTVTEHPGALAAALRGPAPATFDFTPAGTKPSAADATSDQAQKFTQSLRLLHEQLSRLPAPSPAPAPADLSGIASGLLAALNPATTVVARAASLVSAAGWTPADPIEPIMAAPNFPQPMYAPLRDISQELLLPGIGQIPPDCVGLLVPDRQFLESYMVGLNFEMGRQLLWNSYPTDQRGSYFRQFWDPTSALPPATSQSTTGTMPADPNAANYDIAPIHEWAQPLGENVNPLNTQPVGLVLVVRGELLRRYPNTAIYAVPAVTPAPLTVSSDPTQEIYPLFRGTLPPDLTYVAFPLTQEQATTGGLDQAGYFFVMQQHPTEPRFALASFAPGQTGPDSATIASNAYQPPYRVAIHASLMLLPTVSTIDPAAGPAAGGTQITVTGTGFSHASAVSFGTAAATGLAVVSDTQLTVISPPGTAGDSVDVTVTTPAGASAASAADLFTYQS
jgi:hypothetical protein